MEEITIEEMLWHYVSRMNLALENIEKQNKDLEEVIMLLDESFKSTISDKMQDKLSDCKKESKQVQTHFEDALYFLRKQINELEELVI